MNSFDALSGTIDAALAIGIYAAVVFGVRTIVHRTRRTEPNPGNNKWLWLTALGLAATVFVGGGSMTGETKASATTTDRCAQVRTAFEATDDRLTAESPVREKNWVGLQASYVVVNDPQCFDPKLVAQAQAYIQRSN